MEPSNEPNQAAQLEQALFQELLTLKASRISLGEFTKYTFPGYKRAKHQTLLDEKLMAVERYITSGGKDGIGRLIVTMPPRHGKSEKVSIRFPAWFLGRNPDRRVIICSYGSSLAEGFSRQVRNILEDDKFQRVFGKDASKQSIDKPVTVDRESRSVAAWDLADHRGGLVAAGVGGPVTGKGADLLIIDDPVKGDEDSTSEIMRKKTIAWYYKDAYTRLEGSAAVVVMMTRWHENDLIGHLLETDPDGWEVLNLPAIAEEGDVFRQAGEALWPEKYPKEVLEERIKRVVPSQTWNSLYQQRPTAEDGDVFKQEWFIYRDFPNLEDISFGIQVWDTAMTEKEENDASACATLYVTRDGVFLADVYKARLNFPDLKRQMHHQYEKWNSRFRIAKVCIENRVSGTSVLQSLKKDSQLPIIALEPISKMGKSKLSRAMSVSGYVQAGRVSFMKNADFLSDFENELLSFPRGKHDDMVDAFVYGLIELNGGGKAPRGNIQTARGGVDDTRLLSRLEAIAGGYW